MVEENHRLPNPTSASAIASAAMPQASQTTVPAAAAPPATISLTTRPARTGVTTPIVAVITVSVMNPTNSARNGRANRQIRPIVPGFTDVGASAARAAPRIIPQTPSTGDSSTYTVANPTVNAGAGRKSPS